MATYQEIIRFVGIIDRGLARFEQAKQGYIDRAASGTQAAMIACFVINKKLAKSLSNKSWKDQAAALMKRGMLGNSLVSTIAKIVRAEKLISDWQNFKKAWLKQINVSAGNDFTIRVISTSAKGLMVTIKHPAMKAPVTRHLRQKSKGLYTGRAPFGADLFIEYHVNIVGEVLNRPTMTPPMVKILPSELKLAA
jgi:hypothetical protein